MAIIVGLVNKQELARLEKAQYEVTPYIGQNLIRPLSVGDYTAVMIQTDCDVIDLVTPPICKMCGELIDDVQTYDEGDTRVTSHVCPCGAVENHVLFKRGGK